MTAQKNADIAFSILNFKAGYFVIPIPIGISVLMPYVKKHKRKLALSHILMKKYGDKIIFFQKFVYGIKTLIPIGIGMTKYPALKFNILNTISAFFWAVILGYASYMAGETFFNVSVYLGLHPWIVPLVLFSLLGGIWYYFKVATTKKSK